MQFWHAFSNHAEMPYKSEILSKIVFVMSRQDKMPSGYIEEKFMTPELISRFLLYI